MKNLFIGMILLLSFTTLSFAQGNLKEGTFKGETLDGDHMKLFVKNYPGRDGSFFAVLMKESPRKEKMAFVYLIESYSEGKYGMVPIEIFENAVIGISDFNPSLNLSVTYKKSKLVINIVSNDAGNKFGFSEAMNFKLHDISNHERWNDIFAGSYKVKHMRYKKYNMSIIGQNNENESFATANFAAELKGSSLNNGTYLLREVRVSTYLLLANTTNDDGEEINEQTSVLAFAVSKSCGRKSLILINNKTGATTELKRK